MRKGKSKKRAKYDELNGQGRKRGKGGARHTRGWLGKGYAGPESWRSSFLASVRDLAVKKLSYC